MNITPSARTMDWPRWAFVVLCLIMGITVPRSATRSGCGTWHGDAHDETQNNESPPRPVHRPGAGSDVHVDLPRGALRDDGGAEPARRGSKRGHAGGAAARGGGAALCRQP